ncbi:DUF1440 domain-containing protein [Candidatus Contubernalis alkaliaceticus]|uniref:DUF1440 domain-containing protein n=1 Tax=Candidatus Contubernalis alkaliaceticus TaxID=338645 RepID=UPI001F4C2C3B|nr:DUF1440 domain-containing protein [Candidatus Contubernalis alkalaceticus]UNC92671.1 hypothetical protein HUE98_11530 [Candidatus Contubernalis alkalaceticus]
MTKTISLKHKVLWGILAGIAAGMIMGAVGYTLHALGIMTVSGMKLNASMILPSELMDTNWVIPAGMLVHMFFSTFFALIFVFLAELLKYKNYTVLGFMYGVIIFVVNAGIMAPLMALHAPFWNMPIKGMLSTLSVRLIYGGFLGYYSGRWVFSDKKEKKSAAV